MLLLLSCDLINITIAETRLYYPINNVLCIMHFSSYSCQFLFLLQLLYNRYVFLGVQLGRTARRYCKITMIQPDLSSMISLLFHERAKETQGDLTRRAIVPRQDNANGR